MSLERNKLLEKYNTFGINVTSRLFATFHNIAELKQLLSSDAVRNEKMLVLGGGSNILFTSDFDGIVLKNEIQGIEVTHQDNDFFYIRAFAGENWHQFVLHCIEKGWAGLENLSFIPGCVGASPVQNIGAYGIEIKDRLESLEAINVRTLEIKTFKTKDCQFGYRSSLFKYALKGEFIIISVVFRLFRQTKPITFHSSIEKYLKENDITNPTIKNVSDAVISIRSSKLPNPKILGNAGSFFKNPIISNNHFQRIKCVHPDAVAYPISLLHKKVSAGWLIENAGWKGYKNGNCGVYRHQALVLVNYGGATGGEIYTLGSKILESIEKKYGIKLDIEVDIV